jgi:hypothetical protein
MDRLVHPANRDLNARKIAHPKVLSRKTGTRLPTQDIMVGE